MNNDLRKIYKKYGEKMMHLCRDLFPTILEHDNLLYALLDNHFDDTKTLYEDIVNNNKISEFQNYIYSFLKKNTIYEESSLSAYDLLKQKGYTLYKCDTEEDISKFEKYYTKEERLCTFTAVRSKGHHVFFAVKDNALYLDRKKFTNPERQDSYGTSVISIQFTKGGINNLSIKNRYNSHVKNADATFSNNLDNIVPGLTKAFMKDYHLNIDGKINDFSIPSYFCASNNKYYKYNYMINNIYYCTNNIIIDNGKEVDTYAKEKERYLLFDYYILDLKEKKIFLYDDTIYDPFIEDFNNINKIEIINDKINKEKIVIIDNIYLKLDINNRLISYINNIQENISDYYLFYNLYLENLKLNNVISINDYFMDENNRLKCLDISNIEYIGNFFLMNNDSLEIINMNEDVNILDDFFVEKYHNLLDNRNGDIYGR